MTNSTELVNAVKLSLKKSLTTIFDDEIKRLISAAKADLKAAGVVRITDTDENIMQAVALYVHAHFGEADDPARYQACFESLRDRLAMNTEYNTPAAESEAEE